MRGLTRRLGLFGDVAASGVLVAITALVNLASMMIFARSLGPTAFGLLSTCRRVVAFVAPFSNLGTHLGVSRFLGYYATDSVRRTAILSLAILLSVLTLPTTVGIFLPMRWSAANIGWIEALHSSIWLATCALTAATASGLVVFSTLRGFGHPQVANLHQFVVLSTFLVLGASAWGAPVVKLLTMFTASSVLTNCVFIAWIIRRHRGSLVRPRLSDLRTATRELAKYSLPRLADGPLQASLSLICIVLAPGIGGLALSGYIHMSQTVVRMTEIMIVPLSVIFLPLVARQVREGRLHDLTRQAQLIYDSVVVCGCFAVVQAVVWARPVLTAAVGDTYAGAMPYLLVTLPAILPFLLFAGFRSFIDGYSVRPVNFLHLVISSGTVFFLATVIGSWREGLGLSVSYTLAMCVLGALSVSYAARRFHTRLFTRHTAVSVIVACASSVISLPVARLLDGTRTVTVFSVCGATVLLTTCLWLWAIHRLGNPMIVHAVRRIRSATSAKPDQSDRHDSEGRGIRDSSGLDVCEALDANAAGVRT